MKAIVGSWEPRPVRLLGELNALRTRVARLEAEIATLREENAALRDAAAMPTDLDLEMELAEHEPEVALT